MKKLLLILAAVLLVYSHFAAASDDITVIGMTPKASVVTTFGRAYTEAVKGEFYQAANCEDAFKKFASTKNAVAVYNSSVEFGARNKGLDCHITKAPITKVIFVGKIHAYICRKAGSKAVLGSEPTTMGMISLYSTKRHELGFKDAGANIKLVPFSGANAVVPSIYAGDVDFGWLGAGAALKQGKRLDCIASTDPTDANYVGKMLKLNVPDFRIQVVVYTNSTDPAVIKRLENVQNNDKFAAFLKRTKNYPNWNVDTKAAVKDTSSYVDRLSKYWADKH